VFPLEDGEALVALVPAQVTGPVTPQLARLQRDTIAPAPELTRGLPPLPFTGDHGEFNADELFAGGLDRGLWLAHGSPCMVRQWQAGAWLERAPNQPAPGPCARLTAWTDGAALAAFASDSGQVELRAYGAAPAVIPRPAAPPPRLRCASKTLGSDYIALRGFASGEVVAVGRSTCLRQSMIERWAKGSTRGATTDALVDPDYPFTVNAVSPDRIIIEGAGLLPGKTEESQISVEHLAQGGRFTRQIKAIELNALEAWMTSFPARIGENAPAGGDGFLYDSFHLTAGPDVFVAGWIVRGGRPTEAVLLRSRPVAAIVRM
jgi:hypothetical protein